MNYTSDFPCGRLVSFHPAMKPAFLRRFAAFDVETTGLGRNKDRIIEIGCVLFENGQEVRRFQTLVNLAVRFLRLLPESTIFTTIW